MSNLVISPYEIFNDSDGTPLEDGYIYIGVANQNPESNPITVYWDSALTFPAVQPLRTLGGFISRSGTPSNVFVPSDYSITVRDKNGVFVFGAPSDPSLLQSSNDLTFVQAGTGSIVRTAQDKMRESVSVLDKTDDADGLVDDSTPVNNALALVSATGREIDLVGREVYAPSAVNTYGARFRHGKLLQDSVLAGYKDQTNTYADDVNGVMVGRESLAAFMLAVTAGTPNNIYIFGDSTVEMNGLYIPKAEGLVKYALYEAGINWTETVNRGVSGTSWSDLDALPDLGASTKLIVIKYGINDAAKVNALATIAADARSKLTAIRGHASGAYDDLSILLMGPSSVYRPATGQDWAWCEDLRNLYLQLAKEFDCAYFDTYAWLQNTRRAPGMWLDQIAPDNGGIHPTPDAAWWIWFEGFKREVFGDGTWSRIKANHFWNRNGSVPNFTALPTDEPQLYIMGTSIDRATTGNGWPADGTVITTRGGSSGNLGDVRQELTTLDTVPRRLLRAGLGTVWTQWSGVATAISVFLNSWANKGGGYTVARYVIGDDGFVTLEGVITGGTLSSAAFTLPSNARPASTHHFCTAGAATAGTAATVSVFADGNVIIYAAANTTVGLDGIRFRALG